MMFVRQAAGEKGWHALHRYANLTIDDPWLRQPYGHVDYELLLEQMQKHNFHTTIAFIPWNYDRSEAGVVQLFKQHPQRLSIAIHGDNHDHKEFRDYRSKPLELQLAALKQSLARMERFRALTGIPYDRVMIFPHSIAPRPTVEALKGLGYLATVNGANVPQGEAEPSSASFALRPVTLDYAAFPSIRRHSIAAAVTPAFIAISQYLGNPLLFYGHSEDFAKGIEAFNPIADAVNATEPQTRWRGLSEIVSGLYLVRLRDDSDYDVLALSSSVCIENFSGRDAVFHVRKQEFGGPAIQALAVDGRPHPYQLENDTLSFSTTIGKGNTQCAAIAYRNDADLSSVAPARDSWSVYLLRMASDFRDIHLSKTGWGLAFIRFYNGHAIRPVHVLVLAAVFLAAGWYGACRLRQSLGKKRAPGAARLYWKLARFGSVRHSERKVTR
jgi:hypothetical protein